MNDSNCERSADLSRDYVIACFVIVLATLSVAFNLFLVIVIKNSKLLHTCTNAFVLSIAASDFVHATFKMPVVALSKFKLNWEPPEPACEVLAYFLAIGRNSATLSIMMLSIDRCIAIYKPVKYSSIVTPFSTGIFILCIWIVSSLIASIPFWGDISYKYDAYESVCMFSLLSWKHHVVSVTVLSTFIPLVVIIISLSIIAKEARSRHRVIALATLPIVLATFQPKKPINTLRAMKSLFLIVMSHLIFCMPDSILYLVKVYRTDCLPTLLVDVKSVWSILCCIMTPITITLCNKNYGRRLKHLLCRCCRKKNAINSSNFSVSTGLHSILEASYTISHFRPIPSNIILLASESSRVHLRNSVHANPSAQSRSLFEKPMLRKALSSPECHY